MTSKQVRVRFAPSPTGYLHVGGARTALFNYIYAKSVGGIFILRIEDTDHERSTKEFEESQIDDLKWLGIIPDEGPVETLSDSSSYKEGINKGPYRQSKRSDIYQKYAADLVKKGHAYHCFCSDEELEKKKLEAEEKKLPPYYDGTCRDLENNIVQARLDAGTSSVIRFKVPKKSYNLMDTVRGAITFQEDMVGDFVILRSSGIPVYNFCCVIDDVLMNISLVIRGEDHLNNTLRQIMIYEAIGSELPEFAHVSLLIGEDRQKLSKRHGATSVSQYRNNGYLPEALCNYLLLLGWSHPEEKNIFSMDEAIRVFNLKRFSKSPAVFDFKKFEWVNGQHLHQKSSSEILQSLKEIFHNQSNFISQSEEWQLNFIDVFKEKVEKYSQLLPFVGSILSGDKEDKDEVFKEFSVLETTLEMRVFLLERIQKIKQSQNYLSSENVKEFMGDLKKDKKIKGKPLFMGLRILLTGRSSGPELGKLVPLIPIDIIEGRLKGE